jgi:hypothetical protein
MADLFFNSFLFNARRSVVLRRSLTKLGNLTWDTMGRRRYSFEPRDGSFVPFGSGNRTADSRLN